MNRRDLLRTGALGGAAALSGCLGFSLESSGASVPPVPENRPDGVYYPSHVEGMQMKGRAESGDYAVALLYSYAHRFWNVNGRQVQETAIESDDDVHLMAAVWDPESGVVLPDTGLSVEITRDGDLVSQEAIYPMLSQPMGFHYGANFGLDGDGSYTVTYAVGAPSTRRTGAFRDRFTEPATVSLEFDYSAAEKEEIPFRTLDNAGEPGAIAPMEMEMLPDGTAPPAESLPGRRIGAATSNDARLVATVVDAPPAGVDGSGQYLAVSARTRYNEYVLPAMALTGRLVRDGEAAFEGELRRTLDPDLGYHYGAVVGEVASGDELTLATDTWPQTARHEGYETAFGALLGGMHDVTLTVP